MLISLDILEKAFAPIEAVGQGELIFDVSGIPVTLRLITPEQEVEVQRYANVAIQGENTQGDATDYLERFKLAVLSHAIVAIGDNDFRNVDFVETPEKLPNGQAVKLPKLQAVRQLITRWTGPIRGSIFRKYTELIGQVEIKAEKAIQFEPSDIDAEIERVEKRLEQLKAEKERQKKTATDRISDVSKMAKAIREDDETARAARQDNLAKLAMGSQAQPDQRIEPEEPNPTETEHLPVGTPVDRRSSIPSAGAPPVVAPEASPKITPPEAPPQAPPAVRHPNDPENQSYADMYDSIVDSSDGDAMQAAMDAETRRILQLRQAAARQSTIPPVVTGNGLRRPPHRDAQEAQAAMQQQPEFVGTTQDGRETYRMPPEDLVSRRSPGRDGSEDSSPLLDRDADARTVNPRFRPANR